MTSLLSFAKKNLENLINPFGQTDVLLLYGIAASKLKKYLGDRELAGKIWMPSGRMRYLLKRGSKLEPLFAHELEEAVTLEFLELRSKTEHLSSAKGELTDLQAKVWQYFLPRKLSDFFYATNYEGPGKEIDRIFFDIDRSAGISAEQSHETTRIFVETINEDNKLEDLLGNYELFINWTGNSFHVLFFLDESMPSSFYDEHFQYSKNDPERNFTGKWAKKINEQVEFKVAGGHERQGNSINIDPSQTPSGKLCRVPLGSLHMKDPETINGVSVPITEKMLYNENLVPKLTSYTPKDIIENLSEIEKHLPERFR
ncbi:hypothetical protein [Methanobacterium sp.]|uniref:hypothetical protein n=1 Tax=Methanobacterium sp. TaxID=2164 RepID=UPI003C756B5E